MRIKVGLEFEPVDSSGGLVCNDPSLTNPARKEECDLSRIVERFMKTGELPVSQRALDDANALRVPADYAALMDMRTRLTQRFEQLPLEERNRFNNDPIAWLDALDEAEKIKAKASELAKASEPAKASELAKASEPAKVDEPAKS